MAAVERKGSAHLCPVRQCDDDFLRQGRQQSVVSALTSKVLSFSNVWQAPWIGANAIRAVTTDLSSIDLIELGWLQHDLSQRPADRIVLAATPAVIGGIDYVVGDPATDRAQIAQFLGPK